MKFIGLKLVYLFFLAGVIDCETVPNGEISCVILMIEICQKKVKILVISCSKSDPKLNECLKSLFNNWFASFVENGGVFKVNGTDEIYNQGAINVHAKTKNLLARGIANSVVTEAKNDINVLKR
jgi:hypothetical protein